MKKLLVIAGVILGAVALVFWIASWFRAPEAVATSGAKVWPGGMGTLEAVDARYPPVAANDAAVKLASLADALPVSEAVEEYVARETSRGELTIGEAPALPDVKAMRELLLAGPVVWERHVEIGNAEAMELRGAQMTMARALVASALVKARANDPAGWDDLHAVWKLARTFDGHPLMMSQTAALSMARMVNAVAWKMPLPAPAWLEELQKNDNLRPVLEAFQHQTASYWDSGAQMFPTKMLATQVEHDRAIAEEMFNTTRCDVTARPNELGVDVTSVWRRVFRYRAEREASANALRIRKGEPVEKTSRCSDGGWTFDGTTLRFSRAIATEPPDRPMPLVLLIKPQ